MIWGVKELDVGRNANFSFDEWLRIMADVIELNVLEKVRANALIGLMEDESTDIFVTNELILYPRAVFNGELHVYFFETDSYF